MTKTIPKQMIAIEISSPGGPEVLVPVTRPTPSPGENQVLIKTATAGVNRADLLQRTGHYPPPEGASDIPGLEIAGTVAALGPGAKRYQLGDKVCALVSGGAYAQYCVADESATLPIPNNLSLHEAGAIIETSFTVWSNVFDRANLAPGESLLIHGGSSGIGTMAIQMAAALYNTEIFTTAGSADKCQACTELGATHAIDYTKQDFVEEIARETNGRGVDVILDMVGGDYIARNIKAAAVGGRIVNIAYLKTPKAEVNFMPLMLKRLTLTGATLRARPKADKAEIAARVEQKIWPLIEAGKIRPIIDSAFPLADAARAHAAMEPGGHIGKILLDVNSS